MKIEVRSDILLDSLNHVQNIVDKKSVKSILSNVKISARREELCLYTTNLDIFAKECIRACIQGEVHTTVPVHVLHEIIKKIGADKIINLSFQPLDKPSQMIITSGLSKFHLPCLSVEDFPEFEEEEYEYRLEIPPKNLRYLISITKHAIPSDEIRHYLNGVYLHIIKTWGKSFLKAVSTDIHRLAVGEIMVPENNATFPGIIIPKKTITEIFRLLDNVENIILLNVSLRRIMFRIGKTTLISKLIDGTFPDYQKAIPFDNDKVLEVSVFELSKAINLVTAISTERIVAIKLVAYQNKILLTVNDKINSGGAIELSAKYNQEKISVTFNAKYITDILSNIFSGKVRFKFGSDSSAVLVEDIIDTRCRFVLMPMQNSI